MANINQLNFHLLPFVPNFRLPITIAKSKPNNLQSVRHPLTRIVSAAAGTNGAESPRHILRLLPGGGWWKLSDPVEEEEGNTSGVLPEPVSVLRRIWELDAADGNGRWGIYTAFGSLAIAALCEISIPNLLTASIFSAQRGQTTVFYRNLQMLLLLCLASGICSGIRSGCFGVANLILLKRLRERCIDQFANFILAPCAIILGNMLVAFHYLRFLWYQKKAAKYTQEYIAFANEVARETFSLIRTVRSFGTEEEELRRYKRRLEKLASISSRESAAYGLWNFSFNTLYRSTQVVAILFGGMSVLTGHVSAEQLMKYVLYCEWLIYAAWRIENYLSSLLQSVGASEKVFQLIALMPSDQFISEGTKLDRLEGKIKFIDVTFHYPSRLSIPALENVNISVQANEMVAIVGLNGSGKSTLLNLLLRLYEPTKGQILVDGFPLAKLNMKWLRNKIGFVGQEPHLFHLDVKSNIGYGCPRDITQEDIEQAAMQAHAHEFISSLPHRYETIVDDNLLSGGQKQRIAIARAIVRDPTILILDEATSALDAENEYNIARVLHTLRNDARRKRTIIVIAHRLSTMSAADKIVVMDGGRVIEVGNHSELIQSDGLYARLIKIKSDAIS